MVEALAAAAVVIGAIALGDAARRTWSGGAPDPVGGLVVAIVWGLAGLLAVSALLGVMGYFRGDTLVVTTLAAAALAQLAARRPGVASADATSPVGVPAHRTRAEPRWVSLAAIGAVGLVAFLWSVASLETLRFGMADVDAQHYHLPHALRFVQTGHVFDVHHVSAGDLAAYHPNNDELLRAVGMATGRSALPGLVVNWLAAALVLLASLLAGRRWERPGAYVLLASAVLVAPMVGPVYGGRAFNDHLALGLLAVAVALAADARSLGVLATAGTALGLAVGTKLTVLPAAVMLAIALPWSRPPGTGVRRALVAGVSAVGFGSWWFLRNLLATGNPAPGVDVPGLPQPSTPFIDEIGASVLSYATDLEVVEGWFVPGMFDALGWLWPVHLLLVVAGIVLGAGAAVRRSGPGWPWLSVLGGMALATVLAWLTISTGAAGGPREPALFRFNVRYLFPAVLFAGWIVFARVPARWAGMTGVVLFLGTAAPAMQRAPFPRVEVTSSGPALAVVVVVVLAGALAGYLLARPGTPRLLGRVGVVVLVLATAALAGPLREPHLESRYTRGPSRTVLFSAVEETRDLRVGVVGLPLHYGFVGRDHANHVEYIGRPTGDGGFVNLDDCASFMSEIASAGYDLVATLHFSATPPPVAADWLAASPAFEVEASAPEGRLWRVVGLPEARWCPPASRSDGGA